jgi:hypothetical protein
MAEDFDPFWRTIELIIGVGVNVVSLPWHQDPIVAMSLIHLDFVDRYLDDSLEEITTGYIDWTAV